MLLSLSWTKQALNLPYPHLDYSCFNSSWNFILTVNHYFLILYSQYLTYIYQHFIIFPLSIFSCISHLPTGMILILSGEKKSLDIYFNVGFPVVIALSLYLKILYLYSWRIFHWMKNSRLSGDFFLHYIINFIPLSSSFVAVKK